MKHLDQDLRTTLHTQLRNLWTHTSTALEGNTLSAWHFAAGQIRAGDELLPEPERLNPFTELCEQAWQESIALVEEVLEKQNMRNAYPKR